MLIRQLRIPRLHNSCFLKRGASFFPTNRPGAVSLTTIVKLGPGVLCGSWSAACFLRLVGGSDCCAGTVFGRCAYLRLFLQRVSEGVYGGISRDARCRLVGLYPSQSCERFYGSLCRAPY